MPSDESPAPTVSTMTPLRRRKRRLALFLYVVFLGIVFLSLGEILVRLRGGRPYQLAELKTKIEPGDQLFRSDPAMGYSQIPGEYTITLADGYSFHTTHLINGLRATHPPMIVATNRPALWIMGCSFTHGWSLNDSDTYPWRVQILLPGYEVSNFGVNGYSAVQSLMQYRESRKTMPKPAVVVLAYAWFHDERIAFLRSWRKSIVPYSKLGPVVAPYARLGTDGQIQILQNPAEYREWPLQRYSALVHFLEQTYDRFEDRWVHSHAVARGVIKQFASECKADGVPFVLAAITRGIEAEDMVAFCRKEGIPAVNISVSLSEPGSRNLPHDDHPSARSQAVYAEKLASFLRDLPN